MEKTERTPSLWRRRIRHASGRYVCSPDRTLVSPETLLPIFHLPLVLRKHATQATECLDAVLTSAPVDAVHSSHTHPLDPGKCPLEAAGKRHDRTSTIDALVAQHVGGILLCRLPRQPVHALAVDQTGTKHRRAADGRRVAEPMLPFVGGTRVRVGDLAWAVGIGISLDGLKGRRCKAVIRLDRRRVGRSLDRGDGGRGSRATGRSQSNGTLQRVLARLLWLSAVRFLRRVLTILVRLPPGLGGVVGIRCKKGRMHVHRRLHQMPFFGGQRRLIVCGRIAGEHATRRPRADWGFFNGGSDRARRRMGVRRPFHLQGRFCIAELRIRGASSGGSNPWGCFCLPSPARGAIFEARSRIPGRHGCEIQARRTARLVYKRRGGGGSRDGVLSTCRCDDFLPSL